ncbi:hypothetical protein PILCRDRAFT_809782 [Piloderma croceum F 1598]|uniref:Hemerythrin-like domain-containing protein n=1 Tax=Piloderma croceum (strain F 1598) TaxID=765440 RepID=A0A0C3CQ93_PILCF|nr:hypothetical protein PILCRDRAFT_809782 [Piloderma croceum F 1598]
MASDNPAQVPLSSLPPEEQRRWKHLGTAMSDHHQMFKAHFDMLYDLADGSFSKYGLDQQGYLDQARDLTQELSNHHMIEERFIFPILGQRMPKFKAEHLESHKGIHDGTDRLAVLLSKYRSKPASYSPTEMKECLDSWREVLFRHLDEEVADLQADNLRKYWTLQELARIPV